MKETKSTWIRYEFDEAYLKRLREFYSLPWWKRIFRKPPK